MEKKGYRLINSQAPDLPCAVVGHVGVTFPIGRLEVKKIFFINNNVSDWQLILVGRHLLNKSETEIVWETQLLAMELMMIQEMLFGMPMVILTVIPLLRSTKQSSSGFIAQQFIFDQNVKKRAHQDLFYYAPKIELNTSFLMTYVQNILGFKLQLPVSRLWKKSFFSNSRSPMQMKTMRRLPQVKCGTTVR